jgi:hypothetical protein
MKSMEHFLPWCSMNTYNAAKVEFIVYINHNTKLIFTSHRQ